MIVHVVFKVKLFFAIIVYLLDPPTCIFFFFILLWGGGWIITKLQRQSEGKKTLMPLNSLQNVCHHVTNTININCPQKTLRITMQTVIYSNLEYFKLKRNLLKSVLQVFYACGHVSITNSYYDHCPFNDYWQKVLQQDDQLYLFACTSLINMMKRSILAKTQLLKRTKPKADITSIQREMPYFGWVVQLFGNGLLDVTPPSSS